MSRRRLFGATCWLVGAVSAILHELPVSAPVCHSTPSDAGSMFGYSVALSHPTAYADLDGAGQTALTWMAVGKPWDCSVHLFVAVNATTTAPDGNSTTAPPVQWLPVGMVADSKNGTWPRQAYSLFGYSVSMTPDGRFVAVGVPGRTTVPSSTPNLRLEDHEYSGSVRLYRRQDNGFTTTANGSTVPRVNWVLVTEVWNPNGATGDAFWDKFGSKVHLQLGYEPVPLQSSAATDTTDILLFIATSGGWDGASVKFRQAGPDSSQWPLGPTTQVSRSGVYIYRFNAGQEASDLAVDLLQFIQQRSNAPLGTLGIDFNVLAVAASANDEQDWTLALFVRDALRPASPNTGDFSQCLQQECTSSFSNYFDPQTQQNVQLNATGVVIEYVYSHSADEFRLSGQVLSAANWASSNGQESGWTKNDWFGVGIGLGWDFKFGRYIAAVGAPRSSLGVYTFHQEHTISASLDGTPYDVAPSSLEPSTNSQWLSGQFVANEKANTKSFFGHRVLFSADARFLLVADTTGGTMNNGRGVVQLYWRRTDSEQFEPSRFANVPLAALSGADVASPFHYDMLAQFNTPEEMAANLTDLPFKQNHFGFSMAVNKEVLVVSAPVTGCVYTFAMPRSVSVPSLRPTRAQPANYTITPPEPTTDGGLAQKQSSGSGMAGWLIGVIAALVAVLLVTPVAWKLLQRRHKQSVMRALAHQQLADALCSSVATDVDGTMKQLRPVDSLDGLAATSHDQLTGDGRL